MSFLSAVGRLSSVVKVGRKIKNHIYTRRNFLILLDKHSALTKQLRKANEVAAHHAGKGDEVASEYCADYGIPVVLEIQDETDNSGEQTPQS
jgi:hypothetical protein